LLLSLFNSDTTLSVACLSDLEAVFFSWVGIGPRVPGKGGRRRDGNGADVSYGMCTKKEFGGLVVIGEF